MSYFEIQNFKKSDLRCVITKTKLQKRIEKPHFYSRADKNTIFTSATHHATTASSAASQLHNTSIRYDERKIRFDHFKIKNF